MSIMITEGSLVVLGDGCGWVLGALDALGVLETTGFCVFGIFVFGDAFGALLGAVGFFVDFTSLGVLVDVTSTGDMVGSGVGENVGTEVEIGGNVGTGVEMGGNVGTGVEMGDTVGTGVEMGGTVGTGVEMGGTVGTGVEMGGNVGTGIGMGGNVGTGVGPGVISLHIKAPFSKNTHESTRESLISTIPIFMVFQPKSIVPVADRSLVNPSGSKPGNRF